MYKITETALNVKVVRDCLIFVFYWPHQTGLLMVNYHRLWTVGTSLKKKIIGFLFIVSLYNLFTLHYVDLHLKIPEFYCSKFFFLLPNMETRAFLKETVDILIKCLTNFMS